MAEPTAYILVPTRTTDSIVNLDCGHGWRNAADCDACTLRRVAPAAADRIADLEAALQQLVYYDDCKWWTGRHGDRDVTDIVGRLLSKFRP